MHRELGMDGSTRVEGEAHECGRCLGHDEGEWIDRWKGKLISVEGALIMH